MLKPFIAYAIDFPVLFAPFISLLAYLVCLLCRLIAERRNRKAPGTVKEAALERCKTCSKIFGIIAIITWALIGGGALLVYEAVKHM